MKILAIESSALTASVAVMDETTLLAEYTINYKKTHSQTLLPMIEEILSMIEMEADDIDVIAVSEGPGSFTGLRIGAATGKGIALALDKKMVSVPTLKAMAYNYIESEHIICPIMDAKRNHAYAGLFKFNGGVIETIEDTMLISYEELVGEVKKHLDSNKKIIFLGDGVDVAGELLKRELGDCCIIASQHQKTQRAGSVARLALDMANNNQFTDADVLKPDYLRPSQAEREREEKEAK